MIHQRSLFSSFRRRQGTTVVQAIFFVIRSLTTSNTTTAAKTPTSASNLVRGTPVWYDSSNVWHRTIQYHPEQPARIEECVKQLVGVKTQPNHQRRQRSFELRDVTPDYRSTAFPLLAESDEDNASVQHDPFTEYELQQAEDMIRKTHKLDLVDTLRDRCRNSKQQRIEEGRDPVGFIGYIDEGDTYLTTESYDVCVRAAATWIRCVDHVLDEERHQGVEVRPTAMALTRPPGHHATFATANGFCLFSFASAAVKYALEKYPNKVRKVSVLDWDVHYGQGIADILKDEPRARYVSIHQSPAFPYMGNKLEITGNNGGNIKTVPLSAESSWSCGFQQGYEDEVLPFVSSSSSWRPDLVIVCAGYDALDSDELANICLQAHDYNKMTKLLQAHLDGSMNGANDDGSENKTKVPIVFGLEGGYSLKNACPSGNMPDSVLQTLLALDDDRSEQGQEDKA
jgi:acetoin utilization deacetylase AcuC-like enzyme